MKNKIIVFDLDGVLFDSTEHVIDFFLKWFPTLTREIVHEMWTSNFDEELSKFRIDNKPVEETDEEKHERNRLYSENKSKLPVHEGMRELLETLYSNGYTLVINTAALEKNCLPLLEKADILRMFDFVATKKLSASKTEKFRLIAEKYKVAPEEMIFITDTLGDIRDADLANVPTVAVTWGAHSHSFFNREPHKNLVKVVDGVQELQKYLMR
jgi:phosphoglycolate phosphatase